MSSELSHGGPRALRVVGGSGEHEAIDVPFGGPRPAADWGPLRAGDAQWMLERVPGRAFEDLLDVGSGARLALAYARNVRSAIGCDPSLSALLAARRLAKRRHARRLRFHQASPESLPYEGSNYDLVVSAFGLSRLSDPAAAIGEMARVCRKHGRVAVMEVTISDESLAAPYNFVARHRDPAHRRFMTTEHLERLISASGLEIVDGASRDELIEVHDWLGANRDAAAERRIAAFLMREFHGGLETGLRPVRVGGRIHVSERRTIVVGKK